MTNAVPASGTSSPRIMRMVVDLPEPLGPRKPVTTPGETVKLRSSTATVFPYRFVSPRVTIMGLLSQPGPDIPRRLSPA